MPWTESIISRLSDWLPLHPNEYYLGQHYVEQYYPPQNLSYRYQSIASKRSIRLLTIMPSLEWESQIECRLTHHRTPTDTYSIEYEALSYTWDISGTGLLVTIRLGGRDFTVRQNLALALRHLRLSSKSRAMWIDAICINQWDEAEKSEQVLRMPEIYRNAASDLLWLGGESRTDKHAVESIRRLGLTKAAMSMLKQNENAARSGFSFGGGAEELRLDRSLNGLSISDNSSVESSFIPLTFKDMNDTEWKSLHALFRSRRVWERIWIIQELAHSKNITILCGKLQISWNTLSEVLADAFSNNSLLASPKQFPQLADTFFSALKINEVRGRCQDNSKYHKIELLDLLWRFRSWKSTDPRDKLFALLPLIAEVPGIVPDYAAGVDFVFSSLSKFLISERGDLDVICHYNIGGSNEMLANYQLRSWVTDWGKPPPITSVDLGPLGLYAIGGRLDVAQFETINASIPPTRLALFGFEIDTIETIAPAVSPTSFDAINILRSSVPSFLAAAQRDDTEMQSTWDAYWRTMVADRHYTKLRRLSPLDIYHFRRAFEALYWQEQHLRVEKVSTSEFVKSLQSTMANLRFCVTKKGHFAMVPKNACQGDRICFMYGGKVLFVLREKSDIPEEKDYDDVEMEDKPVSGDSQIDVGDSHESDTFIFIGSAYVHAFMDGHAVKYLKAGHSHEQVFLIE